MNAIENQLKKLNQKLKESEEKFRIITEQSNLGISIIQDDRIKYVNQKLADLLGYTIEEFKSWQPREYAKSIHPDDREYVIEQGRGKQLGNDDVDIHYQARLIKSTGEIIWVDNYSTTIIYKERPAILATIIDITEQKIAEQKLKESEKKYRLITENANDIIGILNEKFEIEYINENTLKKVSGYDLVDVIGKNSLQFIHPEDVEKAVQGLQFGLKHMEGKAELRFRLKDGTYRCFESKGKAIKTEEGDLKGIIILRDITARKVTEQKLKESEEKYRLISENANDLISIFNKRAKFEYMNEAVHYRLMGYSSEDLIGKNGMDLIHPDDLERVLQEFKKTFETGEGNIEARIRHKDGHYVWTETTGTNFIDRDNKTKVLLFTRIITERKIAEQKLKESEEKYRYIFENTRFAIILINIDGIIIDCNPSTERITGYKKQELIGRNYRNISIMQEKYFNLINNLFRKLFDGEIVHRIDVEFIKKDGSLIWVNIQASVVKIGEKKFMNVLLYDITERKMAEFLVKEEVKKMKELDQIRKNLMIRISHELKTPLIPVCSGTELILDRHKEQLEGELGEIIKMIQRGGQRLKMLINRLLDLSRLEYDALLLEKQKSNLSEIIKECSSDMMHLIINREIALNLDIQDSFYLEIDAMRIEQVITNILSNAIKNTPPKGEISVSLVKEDNWAKISIADTGIGLTEEEMEKIFTRFGKIERHGIGLEYLDIKGSGLGLFISKEIVDLHGGSIWAESEGRNMGTTFTVKLPIL